MTTNLKLSYDLDISNELPNNIVEISRSQGEHSHKVKGYMDKLTKLVLENQEQNKWPQMDDDLLLKYLRKSYWNPNEAYKQIAEYVEFRKNHKDLYAEVDPLSFCILMDHNIISCVPYRDEIGRRLVIYKLNNWSPAICPIVEATKTTLFLAELVSLEPPTQILGINVLVDMGTINPMLAVHVTPYFMKTFLEVMMYMPINVHQIHIVEQGVLFNIFWPMAKSFLSQSFIDKIHIHGTDLSSLHQHISKGILPLQYGGLVPPYCYKPFITSIAKNDQTLMAIKKSGYRYDEEELERYKFL